MRRAFDDVGDHALLHHGFTPYTRDYEVVVGTSSDPRSGIPPAVLRYLFRYCVEASVESDLPGEIWRRSLDERLIRYETGKDLDGFVWGVGEQALYPGLALVSPSGRTARWAAAIGIDFSEVRIETNAQTITLVFGDLEVTEVPEGYAPFVVSWRTS